MAARPWVAWDFGIAGLGAVAMMVALGLLGCGADAPPGVTVERVDSAGVAIVRNLGGDTSLPWSFTRLFAVGGQPSGPESFYDIRPELVAADRGGRLYVLDSDDFRVAVFGPEGELVRTVGREGGGPGEFQTPLAVAIDSVGRLAVADMDKGALVRFAADGSVLPEQSLGGVLYLGWPIALTGSGIVLQVPHYPRGAPSERRLIAVAPMGVTPIASAELPPRSLARYPQCGLGLRLAPLFAPDLAWAARADTLFVNASGAYAVDVYVDGRRAASIRREVSPRPVTAAMARREAQGLRMNNCALDPDITVRERGYVDELPAIAGIAAAPDGRLWVRRGGVKDEVPAIDVLGADGAYLGTLPRGSPWPVAFLPGGRVAAVEEDSLGVERVAVYRVDKH